MVTQKKKSFLCCSSVSCILVLYVFKKWILFAVSSARRCKCCIFCLSLRFWALKIFKCLFMSFQLLFTASLIVVHRGKLFGEKVKFGSVTQNSSNRKKVLKINKRLFSVQITYYWFHSMCHTAALTFLKLWYCQQCEAMQMDSLPLRPTWARPWRCNH